MYSDGVERALRAALEAHDGQIRKGADAVPYVTHPVHVALILARWGQDEAVIQAGILHDVVEDCEGWTLERVAEEFGETVAALVAPLTEDKSLGWADRKQATIEGVTEMPREAAAIQAADKLHNLRSLLGDLELAADPEEVWCRFRGGREATLAVAESLIQALEERLDPVMTASLRRTLEALRAQ